MSTDRSNSGAEDDNEIIEALLRPKGAKDGSPPHREHEIAADLFELAQVMQSYYSTLNRQRIGSSLIAASLTLAEQLHEKYRHRTFSDDAKQLAELKSALEFLRSQDQTLRAKAESLAFRLATLTWIIARKTRSEEELRRELAGISRKIALLLDRPDEG